MSAAVEELQGQQNAIVRYGTHTMRRGQNGAPPEIELFPASQAPRSPFDLRAIGEVIMRRAKFMLAIFGAIVVVGIIAVMLQTPKYSATALMIIDTRRDRTVAEDQALSETLPSPTLIDSEIEVLQSPGLVRRLIDDLALTKDREWNREINPNSPQNIERVVERVQRAISVRRRALSNVIEVRATSQSPAKAAQMANTLVALYMQFGADARQEVGAQANAWLTQRVSQLREEVQTKEAATEAYRAQSGLLGTSGSTLTEQQITNVQGTVLQAQADLAERQARLAEVRAMVASGADIDSIASAVDSATIRDLRGREADLTRRQADLQNQYLGRHPQIVSNQAELGNVQAQIAAEVRRLVERLQNDVNVTRTRLGILEGNLATLRGELSTNNAALVRLNDLTRDAAGSRSVYESFLRRSRELEEQGQLNTQARFVSAATSPRDPSSPNTVLALAVLIAVGLALGAAAGFLMEAMDEGLHDAAAVEEKLGVPAIVSVPAVSDRLLNMLPRNSQHPAGYLMQRPMSAFAEALRLLRTTILHADEGNVACKVVAITSALPGEGKTTCALGVARIAALSNQKVLLVDCDLRRPTVNALLSLKPEVGIIEVLQGAVPWREALSQDTFTSLEVLPVAETPFAHRDVFGAAQTHRLMSELKAHYDLVILNCPPILAVAEVRALVRAADASILITRQGKTPSSAVDAAIDQVRNAGGRLLGVVLNGVKPSAIQRYSRADSLYYHAAKDYY